MLTALGQVFRRSRFDQAGIIDPKNIPLAFFIIAGET